MSDTPARFTASDEELDRLFAFLARIPEEPAVREQLNWMQTAQEVSELAASLGHPFQPESLIELFRRCNETTYARVGLMDEKLIRVHLRRDVLR
ncbi:MAG: Nif11-like leader peptide family natural product precursor [Synechococcaceae cyanobacterium]|nr:Nif11-like leader peptide family natural product precursor [Synechococcaceae cyanobacterium]